MQPAWRGKLLGLRMRQRPWRGSSGERPARGCSSGRGQLHAGSTTCKCLSQARPAAPEVGQHTTPCTAVYALDMLVAYAPTLNMLGDLHKSTPTCRCAHMGAGKLLLFCGERAGTSLHAVFQGQFIGQGACASGPTEPLERRPCFCREVAACPLWAADKSCLLHKPV